MSSMSLPSCDHLTLLLIMPASRAPIQAPSSAECLFFGIPPGQCLLVAYLEVIFLFWPHKGDTRCVLHCENAILLLPGTLNP